MTACTNKARGAVVAALAGVLALGAVPAVALATGTADAQVDLLVSDMANAFSKGTVTLDDLSKTGDDYTAIATGKALEIKATKVTLETGVDVNVTGDDYELVFYKADKDGNRTGDAMSEIVDAGNYVVVVKAVSGDYAGGEAEVGLVVSGKAFSTNQADYTVYEVNPENAKDVSDKTFIYTGSELDLGVTVKDASGDALVEGEDFEVKFLHEGDSATDPEVEVVDAFDEDGNQINYVAYVTGLNEYDGQVASVPFTVSAYNLSAADVTVTVDDVIGDEAKPTAVSRIIKTDGTELDTSLVDLTINGIWGENTSYAFTVTPKKSAGKNVKGNKSDTVNKVAYEATFKYDGKELGDSLTFYKNKKEAFDWNKLQVFAGDDELKKSQYEITVRNAKGTEVADSYVTTRAGTFEITVAVKPGTTGYEYGGSKTFTVTIYNDSIDADAQVYVSYDNKVITSLEKWYDGDTIDVTDFNVTVKKSNGQNATAYKVSILNSEGKNVTSEGIKDAGEYTLKITSDKLEFSGTTEVPITVHKADLTSVDLGALDDYKSSEYLPINNNASSNIGATLEPKYNTHVKDADGNDTWSLINGVFNGSAWTTDTVSIEKWDAEKGEWVKDSATFCDEAGKYRFVIKGDEDLAKNFEYANDDYTTTYEFVVVDDSNKTKWFEDVLPTDWFFNCVNVMSGNSKFKGGTSVSSNPLIMGYAGTNAFGPNNTINRADVAVILYRMAGAKLGSNTDTDLGYSEVNGWVTGYDDVDGNMYYAKAIAWATKMGIVHGYDNGDFGPTDAITREQLATMLANFAKAVDREDVKLDSEALETMPDAGSVSTFAEKAVSWCVANELMGNDGSIRPSNTITRAETAAMAYNYLTQLQGW